MLKTSLTTLGGAIRSGLCPACQNNYPFLGPVPDEEEPTANATIGGTYTGDVYEDGTLQATGILTVTDPDPGEDAFIAQVDTATSCGTFNVDTAGNWTYDLDNTNQTVQDLLTGQALLEQIVVNTVDGTAELVEITIHGADEGSIVYDELPANYTITPLLESLCITIDFTGENDSANIRYRKSGTSTWYQSLPTYFNPGVVVNAGVQPITGDIATAIFYLDEGTDYDVEVTATIDSVQQPTEIYQATTRTFPTIGTTINLSSIYSGTGGINAAAIPDGTANAWTKVVGDISADGGHDINIEETLFMNGKEYIVFEGLNIKGGYYYGIRLYAGAHFWFKDCEFHENGRAPVSYDQYGRSLDSQGRIIGDVPVADASLYLEYTPDVVIENCLFHTPRAPSGSWSELGGQHPQGSRAIFVHPEGKNAYLGINGQIVIRDSSLYGTNADRFNDLICTRHNGWRNGGFIRDSEIYRCDMSYTNDDIIELDGGQHLVSMHDCILKEALCVFSAIPTRWGPCFIFNNTLLDAEDTSGYSNGSIKEAGIGFGTDSTINKDFGVVNYFNNLIVTTKGRNLNAAQYDSQYSTWVNMQNNIMIVKDASFTDGGGSPGQTGYNMYYSSSGEIHADCQLVNNYCYNIGSGQALYKAGITSLAGFSEYFDQGEVNTTNAQAIYDAIHVTGDDTYALPIPSNLQLPNITRLDQSNNVVIGAGSETVGGTPAEPPATRNAVYLDGDAYIEFPPVTFTDEIDCEVEFRLSNSGTTQALLGGKNDSLTNYLVMNSDCTALYMNLGGVTRDLTGLSPLNNNQTNKVRWYRPQGGSVITTYLNDDMIDDGWNNSTNDGHIAYAGINNTPQNHLTGYILRVTPQAGVVSYSLDEGTGTVATDSIGTADGTIYGITEDNWDEIAE